MLFILSDTILPRAFANFKLFDRIVTKFLKLLSFCYILGGFVTVL